MSPIKILAKGWKSFAFWSGPAPSLLMILAVCLAAGGSRLQAFPINYNVSATLGAVTNGGPDVLHLAGKPLTLSGTIDSDPPYTANLHVTVGGLSLALPSLPVSFSAGTPGSISISTTVAGIPFSAIVKVNLTTAAPYPFPSEGIAGGSTVTYGAGSNSTVITVANGTVTATSTGATLSADPSSLSFSYVSGGSPPVAQDLTVSAASAAAFTAAAGNTWVVLSATSGTTGSPSGTISVSVDPTKLASQTTGTFRSSVILTPTQGGATLTVNVTLNVTGANGLILSPSSLSFSFETQGQVPQPQTISVGSGGAVAISFTAVASTSKGGSWLSVSPGNASTPTSLTAAVDPVGLTAGTYNGTITLTTTGGVIETVAVSLDIGSIPTFTAIPNVLIFSSEVGTGAPDGQTIAVTNGSKLVGFTAAASGGNWLSVAPLKGSTPASVRVFVNPDGLSAGDYLGAVTITPAGGQNAILVPVTFTLIPPITLTAAPNAVNFSFQVGGPQPGALGVNVTSGGLPVAFTAVASTTSGASWLGVSASSGTTPAALTLTASPTGLAPGTYTGSVQFKRTAGGNTFTVPVTLAVTAMPALVNNTSALAFAFQAGGSAPATRSISIGSSAGAFTASASAFTNSGGPWLTVSPSTAVTPANLIVSVNTAGLTPNTYTGSVNISTPGVTNTTGSIPVVLLVASGPAVAASPTALTFGAPTGSSPPPLQIDMASTGAPVSVQASAAADAGGTWLSVSPSAGTAPGAFSVTVNSSALDAGAYTGTVTLSPAGAPSPIVIPVALNISAPVPTVQAITDAASFQSGAFAPMSIVTLWGSGMGPAEITPLRFTAAGSIDTTLAQTQVLFNGVAAPLLMVQANQVNAIIPGSVSGTVKVQVVNGGVTSNEFDLQISPSAPYLFSAGSSGQGQGAILNQDTSPNTAANPAVKGSVVVIFGDGAGALNPQEADGSITTTVLANIPKIVLPVSVQIGGVDAEVTYAGPAPGEVAGLMQVNARVPAGVSSGAQPVIVKVGAVSSQSGITLAVK